MEKDQILVSELMTDPNVYIYFFCSQPSGRHFANRLDYRKFLLCEHRPWFNRFMQSDDDNLLNHRGDSRSKNQHT